MFKSSVDSTCPVETYSLVDENEEIYGNMVKIEDRSLIINPYYFDGEQTEVIYIKAETKSGKSNKQIVSIVNAFKSATADAEDEK